MCSQMDSPDQHDGPTYLRPRKYVLSGGTVPGRLALSTPWAREGIRPDDRTAIEALIPAGWTVGVSCSQNRAWWLLWTVSPEHEASAKLRISHGMPLPAALRYALAHWGLAA